MSDYSLIVETRRATILASLGAQGLKVLPDQVIRLGGSGGALRSFGPSLTFSQRMLLLSPLAYWRLNEVAGTSGAGSVLDASGNSRTGTPTAVTFGGAGIGDGFTSASFDGTTSYINVYSAALNAGFSGAAGTLLAWLKVSGAGVWTDAALRVAYKIYVDGSNTIKVYRSATANRLAFDYVAGGTAKTINVDGLSYTDWFQVAITWTKAGDQAIAYINGAQVGATQTGLGTWAGNLSNGNCQIGSTNTTPAQVWSGSIAHAALFPSVLTPSQIAALANP